MSQLDGAVWICIVVGGSSEKGSRLNGVSEVEAGRSNLEISSTRSLTFAIGGKVKRSDSGGVS